MWSVFLKFICLFFVKHSSAHKHPNTHVTIMQTELSHHLSPFFHNFRFLLRLGFLRGTSATRETHFRSCLPSSTVRLRYNCASSSRHLSIQSNRYTPAIFLLGLQQRSTISISFCTTAYLYLSLSKTKLSLRIQRIAAALQSSIPAVLCHAKVK